MPVKLNKAGALRRAKINSELKTTEYTASQIKSPVVEKNIIEWATLFRRNWHIYVDMVLRVKLRPIQQIMIYLMGVSDNFFAICSRGTSKSFLVALGAIVKFMLYPYSEIIITASTIPQANRIAEDKIRDELIKKLSPYLLYLYNKELIVVRRPDDGYIIENKLNGSFIKVLPCQDSSRGARATLLIYEEARLLKKGLIDAVFEKMAHPRQAKYLNYETYSKEDRWKEECQHIYITSARFKYEWFYRTFQSIFKRHFLDKHSICNIFAMDIFTAIKNGFKTWGDYRNGKNGNQMDFLMEDLNQMIGESEDAFFTIKSFKTNQTLAQVFRPPSVVEAYVNLNIGNREKEDNEIRLVIADYAFANTTTKFKNDNTIIMCMALKWRGNKFVRCVEYIESWTGSDSIGANDRVRELRYDYNADFVIQDQRSGGEVLYNHMTEKLEKPERGDNWNSHGLTIADNIEYQVVSESKLADLRNRTVDPEAIHCVIPIIGTAELNHLCWVELKKQLESNNVKFLISMQEKQEELEDSGEFFRMTPEEIGDELAPYGETDLLIQEAVNLKTEIRMDKVHLSEPRTGTKDRAVVLAYGNYVASLIENQWKKQMQKSTYDLSKIQLVW